MGGGSLDVVGLNLIYETLLNNRDFGSTVFPRKYVETSATAAVFTAIDSTACSFRKAIPKYHFFSGRWKASGV